MSELRPMIQSMSKPRRTSMDRRRGGCVVNADAGAAVVVCVGIRWALCSCIRLLMIVQFYIYEGVKAS